MPTVVEQARAEAQRRRLQEEADTKTMAEPGPTVAKDDLVHAAKIEKLKRAIMSQKADIEAQSPSWLPNLDMPMVEHGATFGLDVPLSGLAQGLNFFGDDGSSFGERYEAGELARRALLDRARTTATAPAAQEIAGSLLSGGPAGGTEAFLAERGGARAVPAAQQSILRSGAEAGGVGAGTGFAHGVSTGEGDWRDRVLQGGKESLLGGVAGSLLGAGGRALQPETGPAVARVAQADEFGIPMTRGQATGDVAQQKAEQELIHGAKGPGPQGEMAAHQGRVNTAIDAAGEDIRDRFSPFRGGDRTESGQLLTEGLRRRADRLRAVGGGRIEEALNSGAEVDASHILDLPQRLETALAGPNPQVPEHYIGVNTPVAAEAMQRVRDFVGTVPTEGAPRISLAGVNQLRRNLLSLSGQSDLDNRALSAIKREVDNWIDDIAGSDPALAGLRHGNDLYRQGSEIVNPRGRDVTPADKNVAKMAGEDAIGEDAVRIFKVGQQGQVGPEAARTARAISERFGANSPPMQRVRDIATTSLLDGGPQRVGTQIDNFLTNSRSTAEAMFTPDQIAELERFRDAVRNLVPDPAATNPSKSSYGVMKTALRSALVGGGAILGSKMGGDAGFMVDAALTAGGAMAGHTMQAALGQRAANKALQPIPGGEALLGAGTQIAKTAATQPPDRETLTKLLSKVGM